MKKEVRRRTYSTPAGVPRWGWSTSHASYLLGNEMCCTFGSKISSKSTSHIYFACRHLNSQTTQKASTVGTTWEAIWHVGKIIHPLQCTTDVLSWPMWVSPKPHKKQNTRHACAAQAISCIEHSLFHVILFSRHPASSHSRSQASAIASS
jgi:hypothetical protein